MKNLSLSRFLRGIILFSASILVVGLFLFFAPKTGYFGFPLDDAWIHQVYARNLALNGEWAFNPGEPSGGSTSPLWSIILSGAYYLSISPIAWVAILGCLTLFGLGWLADSIFGNMFPDRQKEIPWVGLFFILEWHMVWAALSGMETALFILFVLAVFQVLGSRQKRYWVVGLLIGVAAWVRPDGITLLGPAIFVLFFDQISWSCKIEKFEGLIIAFLFVFLPYLVFNFYFAGDIWPSTFHAKQVEYQVALVLPIYSRLGTLILPILAGGGVILLPGVIAAIWAVIKMRNYAVLSILLWVAGFILLYTFRLPVNYQHGRYMMPAMAGFFLTGLWGMFQIINGIAQPRIFRLISRVWIFSLAGVCLAFLALGISVYQKDVAIIETEMVQTAIWVEEYTPVGSKIAAHDIGALGYFADRHIIDLAGLINPKVIPIIRNEKALAQYLNEVGADFLVTFPGWYTELIKNKEKLFSTNGSVAPGEGGENMSVYSW